MSTKETTATGTYEARRSQRVSVGLATSDGDIWQENLAVCEGSTSDGEPRLVIRSYFRNNRTKDRVWDEPPSGAGTVIHADQATRSRAEQQKKELQWTLDMIPPEVDETDENNSDEKIETPKKKGIFGRFSRNNKKKVTKDVDNARDLNLQRAIARSMADQIGGYRESSSSEPVIYYDDEAPSDSIGQQQQLDQNFNKHDDEDIELAKVLSMSVETAQQNTMTEEEILQKVLEQSREEARMNEATGVASMPDRLNESFSSFHLSPATPKPAIAWLKTDVNEEDDDDVKVRAPPKLNSFDPYAN